MASRSFKPASYLASASGPNRSPGAHARPSFTRTNSSSSNVSTKSDDSLAQTFKGLSTVSTDKTSGGEVDGSSGKFSPQLEASVGGCMTASDGGGEFSGVQCWTGMASRYPATKYHCQ